MKCSKCNKTMPKVGSRRKNGAADKPRYAEDTCKKCEKDTPTDLDIAEKTRLECIQYGYCDTSAANYM